MTKRFAFAQARRYARAGLDLAPKFGVSEVRVLAIARNLARGQIPPADLHAYWRRTLRSVDPESDNPNSPERVIWLLLGGTSGFRLLSRK